MEHWFDDLCIYTFLFQLVYVAKTKQKELGDKAGVCEVNTKHKKTLCETSDPLRLSGWKNPA